LAGGPKKVRSTQALKGKTRWRVLGQNLKKISGNQPGVARLGFRSAATLFLKKKNGALARDGRLQIMDGRLHRSLESAGLKNSRGGPLTNVSLQIRAREVVALCGPRKRAGESPP